MYVRRNKQDISIMDFTYDNCGKRKEVKTTPSFRLRGLARGLYPKKSVESDLRKERS